MCGISGFISNKEIGLEHYRYAHRSLGHRGPDDEGYLISNGKRLINLYGDRTSKSNRIEAHINEIAKAKICLGHYRLSIIDLSDNAHQPLFTEDQRYAIIFNGEIYNYIELRKQLQNDGYRFKSNSDTEVVLYSFLKWREKCFNKFNGMWAIAIIDCEFQRLYLSRDRFGIKPLYIYSSKNILYFASEIKFFRRLGINLTINNNAVANYIDNNLIDYNDTTFYNEISSIPSSHYLEYDYNAKLINKKRYWNIDSNNFNKLSNKEAKNELYRLFLESLSLRMRSDVPVGTLLSGGLDSTAIVSLLCRGQNLQNQQLQSFSAVFNEKEYSELKYIKDTVSLNPQIQPNYIFPSPKQLIDDLEILFNTIETPFRSLSVYAQFCIYRYIKQNTDVKVLLNGQGGDELFAGYSDHYIYYFYELIQKCKFDKLFSETNSLYNYRGAIAYRYLIQAFNLLSNKLPEKLKYVLKKLIKTKQNNSLLFKKPNINRFILNNLNQKLKFDLMYSPLPEYLRYEDRNSMAFSLESRLPFLDFRIVEFANRLKPDDKINKGINKCIVRKAFIKEIPSSIIQRKDKMGFVTPQKIWQHTVLKKYMKEVLLLDEKSGLINQKLLANRYSKMEKDGVNDTFFWWRLFCFKYWYLSRNSD